jgi:hypothetical protein
MVFQRWMGCFLTLSNAAQSSEILGHLLIFFMELSPPLAQPPLSPTTVTTTYHNHHN